MIYCISDIHGCFAEFKKLLGQIKFSDQDQLYILGDLIDRGPNVDKCVEWLVDHRANDPDSNVHFLMGNHEEMMSWALEGSWHKFRFDCLNRSMWEQNGGKQTIRQLKHNVAPTDIDAFQKIVENAPKGTTLAHPATGETILLSHAGIRPAEPESEYGEWLIQSEEDLMWIGREWYTAREQPPFQVISGHVPTMALAYNETMRTLYPNACEDGDLCRIMHIGYKHDIDCGCIFGGKLGVLMLDTWEEDYIDCMSL